MKEFKTQITQIADLQSGAFPTLRGDLGIEAGLVDELLVGTNGTTGARFVLFRYEYEMARNLCDGISQIDHMLSRAARDGTPLDRDQLAAFLLELSMLGVVERTLGIEPSAPVITLPWRNRTEPAIPAASLDEDGRRALRRAVETFRAGDLDAALETLAPLGAHPVAARCRAMWTDLAAALAPPPPPPDVYDADLEADGFVDEKTDLLMVRVEAPPTKSEAPKRSRRWMVAAAGLLLLALVPAPFQLRHPCALRASRLFPVRAALASTVTDVDVREGERVVAGQRVAGQDTGAQQARVEGLRASLEQAEADLRLIEDGPRDEQLLGLRARVTGIARAHAAAARRAQSIGAEVRRGEASKAERVAAQGARQQLLAELRAAEAELKLVEAGARTEDVQKVAADVEALKQQLAFEELVLRGADLKAPGAGQVVSPRVLELVGQSYAPGETVLEIMAVDELKIDVLIPERDFDSLIVGAKVDVRLASFPHLELSATIERIASEVRDGVVIAEARVRNPGPLYPGMTGWAELDAGWRPLSVIFGRRAVRWVRVNFLV